MRGDITRASILVPLCCTRKAKGFLAVPRSICAVKASPLARLNSHQFQPSIGSGAVLFVGTDGASSW